MPSTEKPTIPQTVLDLVDRFDRNLDAYKFGNYNETQVRREFLDPLFKALGWDIDNEQGYAEAYKDVIHEDAIKVGEGIKAPDYCFRIGGARKFFLEAKKPVADIKNDAGHAFQLRRYGWTTKLPLSILTDFEEFAVYDCRIKPDQNNKASVARILYIFYTEYATRWHEIANVFSRDSVLKGSFDKYAESSKAKQGTAAVDDEFLKTIETWRKELAENLALRNKKLSQRELNFAVQRIIDRIIFLRICEGRGVEEYGRLRAAADGEHVYLRLGKLFGQADDRYNSGLFHFKAEKGRHEAPDELTLSLDLDDKLLRGILSSLYYPDSPYVFSALPVDVLGQVYEQFLGKVIRLTDGHRAKVEEKPEVKKAHGVYYTPTYIVEYIVLNSVGKLLEDKSPKQAAKLKVLDPACGSGAFLLGAYGHLLNWHLNFYTTNDPQKWAKGNKPVLVQSFDGGWKLTIAERKRILLDNIYGVDIDAQAVETTKLSLLLKVLEGETGQTIQPELLHERALPDLTDNIKSGNSLIGPDFYQQQKLSLLDEQERYRINVFDLEKEFLDIFKAGGFDVVIGNPPYIRSQSLGEEQRFYYRQKYQAATATYDIYVLFVERALSLLNKHGIAGFILPNKFFTTDYGAGLRALLTTPNRIQRIVDFEDGQVFVRAGTYTCLLFFSKEVSSEPSYAKLGHVFRDQKSAVVATILRSGKLDFQKIKLKSNGERWTLAVGGSGELLTKLHSQFPPFSSLGPHIFQGLKTSADKIYLLTVTRTKGNWCEAETDAGKTIRIERAILRPVVRGEHVQRYSIDRSSGLHIIYPYQVDEDSHASIISQESMAKDFPLAWDYLKTNKPVLGARDKGIWSQRSNWYAYARAQNLATFLGEKLLLPYMTTRLRAAPDTSGELFFVNITTGGYGLRVNYGKYHQLYLVGLLNSKLMDCAIQQMTNAFRGGYFAVNKQAIERLPFRRIDFSNNSDRSRHDQIVKLVGQMLELQQRLSISNTPHEKNALERQVTAADAQIDRLVYDLYDLTEYEISIVDKIQT